MDFWYSYLKFVLGAYLNVLGIRAEVLGRENIPSGPKIVVANHPNATDSFHLVSLFREKINALIEMELMRRKIVGRWLQLADQIPVITGRGKEALQAAQERLEQGNVVLIYPEAKLTRTHSVTRAGTGVARLALAANVPIVPIGFYVPERYLHIFRGQTREGRPTAGAWQIRGKTYINVGQPLSVSREDCKEESYQVYRRVTDDIMRTIAELAEQARQFATAE
jgi:1-acyl-sn-glycerol-3-phosphate acyltransferase